MPDDFQRIKRLPPSTTFAIAVELTQKVRARGEGIIDFGGHA